MIGSQSLDLPKKSSTFAASAAAPGYFGSAIVKSTMTNTSGLPTRWRSASQTEAPIVSKPIGSSRIKVFSEGASDESLADLAEVLGADNLAALAVLNQMDSLASRGEDPTPAEASPSSNHNGPRVAETHVTQLSGTVNGRWVPTKAEREKLLAAGWSEEDLTVSAIASGLGPLDPDVPFTGATANDVTS